MAMAVAPDGREPYVLVARASQPEPATVTIGTVPVGPRTLTVIAGPCAVENTEQTRAAARIVRAAGAHLLRGGAYKPRTSPYSFQGLAARGLEILVACREDTGLPFVTEVVDVRDVADVAEHADALQIGSRNMHNFALLTEVGRTRSPVLLKRGLSATVEEWLLAAEYIAQQGNLQIILCERGIRTFEPSTRNTLDLGGMIVAKLGTHLPVIADPSHAVGRADLVPPMARAAVSAGADGVMVEVHPSPEEALCDGPQALTRSGLESLMADLATLATASGRSVSGGVHAT